MCYNIEYIEKRGKKYAERYKEIPIEGWDKAIPEELPVYYFVSGFSHPELPVVNHDGIQLYQWGLIPFWVRDAKAGRELSNKTLNAVGETAFDKPSFRKSIASKRGLLGLTGFYEWRDVNGVKYPYHISVKSETIFSVGVIYDQWVDKSTGEVVNSFSIVTTAANPLMEKIHNLKKRMPLILKKEDEAGWVDPGLSKEAIMKLIKPYDESDMKAYTVSKRVNSARTNRNVPEISEPVEYAELRD